MHDLSPLALCSYAGGLVVAAFLSYLQARTLADRGSDQAVHIFLIQCIKENGYRLFTRIPRLLNPGYVGSYPMFIHWCLARLAIPFNGAALFINPLFNCLIVLSGLIATLAFLPGYRSLEIAAIILLLALTPQYYHAFSARNFGISARSAGIFLFVVFYLLVFQAQQHDFPLPYLVAIAFVGYLIIGSSTFATQAMVLISIPVAILTKEAYILLAECASFLFIVVFHRDYGRTLIVRTIGFMKVYRREWAPIFLFSQRPSIWRDLIYDIWKKFFNGGPKEKALSYAYGNSVVIVIFLNPLAIAGVASFFRQTGNPFLHYCAIITMAGIIMWFITCFRAARFLGEPERYIEMVSAFASIAGGQWLLSRYGITALAVAAAWFILIDVGQITIAMRLARHIQNTLSGELSESLAAIQRSMPAEQVRFSSNNDQLMKLALPRPWRFAQFWTYDLPYAGRTVLQAFTSYPYMNPDVFRDSLQAYELNAVLVDKTGWPGEFHPNELEGFYSVYDGRIYATLVRAGSAWPA